LRSRDLFDKQHQTNRRLRVAPKSVEPIESIHIQFP
jgi:hypothetical protein